MPGQLNNATILVNNVPVSYEAESLSYKDGKGEYKVRNAVLGGGQTEQIFSEDLATRFGMVKFSMPNTIENANLAKSWKENKNNNVVEINATIGGAPFTRIFTQASILGDPEYLFSTDGSVELEFNSNPAQ